MSDQVTIKHFAVAKGAPSQIRQSAHELLSRTIAEGSVELPCDTYDAADSWTLALKDEQHVVGFAAHRYFATPVATYVQVMGTFLDRTVRGRTVVPAINGLAPLQAFKGAPRVPVYLCTRTRNPAAYAAANRFFDVYPKIPSTSDSCKNAPYGQFAEGVARMIYGAGIEFDRATFRMRGSYPSASRFLPHGPDKESSEIRCHFHNTINYASNEAIFMISRVGLKHQMASCLYLLRGKLVA